MYHYRLNAIILINATILLFLPAILGSQGSWNVKTDLIPDIIIHNGQILTMEQIPTQVEAVAIQGNSISAIGDENEILALKGSNTLLIDLKGKTLLPGFIDSHGHWIGDRNQSEAVDNVIETVLSNGWTSISELFVNQDRLDELRTLDKQGTLRVRVNAYLPLNYNQDRFGNWYQAYQPGYEYSPNLRIAGVKVFMDAFYLDRTLFFEQTELDALFQEAHDLGFQIATHSHSVDNATDTVLNSLEKVLGEQSNQNYRHRIEHLVVLRDDQIQRMTDLGIIASFQLTWLNSDWTSIVLEDLPQDYIPTVGRWRDLLQVGVPSIGSTDYPYVISATGDPLEGSINYWGGKDVGSAMKAIYSAVTRIGEYGLTPPDWMLNQTISVEQALRLITIDAAYGTFQEDIKGSIKVGKLADLVVLSDNPLTVPENNLANIEVLLTMVGGVVEYCNPDQLILCNGTITSSTLGSSTPTTTITPTITTTTEQIRNVTIGFEILTLIWIIPIILVIGLTRRNTKK